MTESQNNLINKLESTIHGIQKDFKCLKNQSENLDGKLKDHKIKGLNQVYYNFPSKYEGSMVNKMLSSVELRYYDLIQTKGRVTINRIYQLLKSCNGDSSAILALFPEFSSDDLDIIYKARESRQINKAFTPEDDEMLFQKVNEYGMNFKKIARFFKDKTPCDLKRRYMKIKTLNNLIPFEEIKKESETNFKDITPSTKEQTTIETPQNDISNSNIREKPVSITNNIKININNFKDFIGSKKQKSDIIEKLLYSETGESNETLNENNHENINTALSMINQILYNQQSENAKIDINNTKVKNFCKPEKSVKTREIKEKQFNLDDLVNDSFSFNSEEDKLSFKKMFFQNNNEIQDDSSYRGNPTLCNEFDSVHNVNATNSNSHSSLEVKVSDESEDTEILLSKKRNASFDEAFIIRENLFDNDCRLTVDLNDEDKYTMMKCPSIPTNSPFITNDPNSLNRDNDFFNMEKQIKSQYEKSEDILYILGGQNELNKLQAMVDNLNKLNSNLESIFAKVSGNSSAYNEKYEEKMKKISSLDIKEKTIQHKKKTDDCINEVSKCYLEDDNSLKILSSKIQNIMKVLKSNFLESKDKHNRNNLISMFKQSCSKMYDLITAKFDKLNKLINLVKIKIEWLQKVNEFFN